MKPCGPTADIDLGNFIPFLLTNLTRSFHVLIEQECREFNISIADWRILVCLSRSKTCTLTDIMWFTKLPQSSTSRAIRKMEGKQLVTNSKNAKDGRFSDIRISETGIAIVSNANERILQAVDMKFRELPGNVGSTFLKTVTELIAIMEPGDTRLATIMNPTK